MTPAARERARVQLPLLAIGAAAWVVLAVRTGTAAHGAPHLGGWTPLPFTAEAVLMFAAMMVPLGGAPVRHVRDRSLARRRVRAVALFAAGYVLPWFAATAMLLWVGAWIAAAGLTIAWALAVVAVAAWQCSPQKQRCLNRCHAHPALAAFGARADLDVLRFGVSHAAWCIGSCLPLMLLPMLLTRGELVAMAGVTLWLVGERLEKPTLPRFRWRGPGKILRIAVGQARAWRDRFAKDVLIPRVPRRTLEPDSPGARSRLSAGSVESHRVEAGPGTPRRGAR